MPKVLDPLDKTPFEQLEQALRMLAQDEQTVTTTTQDLAARRDELEEIVQRGRPISQQQKAATEERKRLVAALETAETELTEATTAQSEAERERDRCVLITKDTVHELDGVDQAIRQLQESLRKQLGPLKQLRQKTQTARAQLDELRRDIAQLDRLIAGRERDYWTLRSHLEDIDRELRRDEQKLGGIIQAGGNYAKLASSVEQLRGTRRTVKREFDDVSEQLSGLRGNRGDRQARAQVLSATLELQLERQLEKAENQYKADGSQMRPLTLQQQSLRKRLDRETSALNDAEARLKDAQRDREQAQRTRDQLDEGRSKAVELEQDLKRQLQPLAQRGGVLEGQVTDLQAALQRARTKRDASVAQADQRVTNAKEVAQKKVDAVIRRAGTFGDDIAKIPTAIEPEVQQIRTAAQGIHGDLASVPTSSAQASLEPLRGIYTGLAALVERYNRAVNETKRALDDEFDGVCSDILGKARTRANPISLATILYVDNDLKKQNTPLRTEIEKYLYAHHRDCLLTPATVEQDVLVFVDEWVRRWNILQLKTEFAPMCFQNRIPATLKGVISYASVHAARNALDGLRLNPTLIEWRQVLGVPSGGDYTFSGRTSSYDGVEIHVTISYESIQDPGTITNHANGQSLRNALYGLPGADWWKEVHATFNQNVSGANSHPAIFFSGRDKWFNALNAWFRSQDHTLDHAAAQLKVVDARAAVQTLLNWYTSQLTAKCTTVLGHIQAGRDIAGNARA